MLIAYRPELENPPREGGFGIITDGGMIQLAPGLNQGVPEDQWKKARDNSTVKRMMTIGAIEEVREQPTVETIPHDVQTLANLPIIEASRTIELIHDPRSTGVMEENRRAREGAQCHCQASRSN
jgi:hypothetical protein